MIPPLTTVGYENATQPTVLNWLKSSKIELLIDVRAVASSRKAGFSKTLLAGGLKAEGIGYLHLKDLGTPKAGRQAARAGRIEEMREIFSAHMQTDTAVYALERAIAESREKRVCLMCYEEDHRCCHRAILVEMIHDRTGAKIVNL